MTIGLSTLIAPLRGNAILVLQRYNGHLPKPLDCARLENFKNSNGDAELSAQPIANLEGGRGVDAWKRHGHVQRLLWQQQEAEECGQSPMMAVSRCLFP